MFLARVKGHVVITQKDPAMRGYKLLVVEPLRVDYADADAAKGHEGQPPPQPSPARGEGAGAPTGGGGGTFQVTGRAIVAVDTIGAGEGQLVLITQGSSARMAEGFNKAPVDAVIVGIVDEAMVMGRRVE